MSLLPANFMSATWGANFVGTLLSCVSYGVLVAVAWTYFSRFMHDRWAFKALAVFMLVIGTADTAISKLYVGQEGLLRGGGDRAGEADDRDLVGHGQTAITHTRP